MYGRWSNRTYSNALFYFTIDAIPLHSPFTGRLNRGMVLSLKSLKFTDLSLNHSSTPFLSLRIR